MVLGILSDTHGRADMMAAAVTLLHSRGADYFLHCGDVGGPDLLDHLAGFKAAFVWGNTDGDRAALQRHAASLGITCCGDFGDLLLGGKSIALMHGDDHALKQRLLDEQRHDYLFQGHTHLRLDQRIGRVRLINPGALQRAAQKTVALLDTDRDDLQFLSVA
jgi:putative phosphoesterase